MTVRLKEIWIKVWPLAAGIFTAVLIIQVFQILSPVAFGPYEQENPFGYSAQVEQFKPVQVRHELLGLIAGITLGVTLYRVLSKRKQRIYALMIPGILLLVISISIWHFTIPVELLWLALPVWTLLAFVCYQTGEYVSKRIKAKRKTNGS